MKTLKSDIEDLNNKIEELHKAVDGLVEAWSAAQGMVKFVKFVASMVVSVGAIWFAITHWRGW